MDIRQLSFKFLDLKALRLKHLCLRFKFRRYSATAIRANLAMIHTIQIVKGVSAEIDYPRNYKVNRRLP